MNDVAEFIGVIRDDGDRYDVWEDPDTLYLSEFCQDNLQEVVDPEKRETIREKLGEGDTHE